MNTLVIGILCFVICILCFIVGCFAGIWLSAKAVAKEIKDDIRRKGGQDED